MISLAFLVLLGLMGITLIDVIEKKIPSFFLSGFMFLVFMVHFSTYETAFISLSFGALGLIYALILYDMNFFHGHADIKFIVIIGMMISSINIFSLYVVSTLAMGMAYKITSRVAMNYGYMKEDTEIPFLPVLYAGYIILFIMGVVA